MTNVVYPTLWSQVCLWRTGWNWIDFNHLYSDMHVVWEQAKRFLLAKGYKLVVPQIDMPAHGCDNLGDQTSSRVRKKVYDLAYERKIQQGHVIDVAAIGWSKGQSKQRPQVVVQWPGNC